MLLKTPEPASEVNNLIGRFPADPFRAETPSVNLLTTTDPFRRLLDLRFYRVGVGSRHGSIRSSRP